MVLLRRVASSFRTGPDVITGRRVQAVVGILRQASLVSLDEFRVCSRSWGLGWMLFGHGCIMASICDEIAWGQPWGACLAGVQT